MAIASAAEGYFACDFMYVHVYYSLFFFSSVVCVEAQVLCIYCWSICCVITGIDVAGRGGPELVSENENENENELEYAGEMPGPL